jgi:glycosyltransferase involved in cell wall biosynthesis
MTTILYVSSAGDIGGAEVSLLRILKRLDRSKFKPFVLCCRLGLFPRRLSQEHVEYEVIPFDLSLRRILHPVSLVQNILSLMRVHSRLRDERYDLVCCNDNLTLKLLFMPLALCRKPIVCHLRNFETKRVWMVRYLLRHRITRAIAVSHAVKSDVVRRTHADEDTILVLHMGIDTDSFTRAVPGPLRAELRLNQDDKLIGMIARFDVWKGHFCFLKAAQHVLGHRRDVHFVIIGEVTMHDLFPRFLRYKNEVLEYAEHHRLQDRIHFLGWREDIPSALKSLDILVCPSENEPFGLVLLEASAAGVPVIGADSGGIPEIIRHRSNGLLFKPGDDLELAKTIEELLDDNGLRSRLIAKGYEIVKADHSMERFMARVEEVYEKAIA